MASMCLLSCKIVNTVLNEAAIVSRTAANHSCNIYVRRYHKLTNFRESTFGYRLKNEKKLARFSSISMFGQFRLNSTFSESQTTTLNSEFLSNDNEIISKLEDLTPLTDVSDVVNTVSTVAEPTLASLGLGGWAPSGLVQSALETLHNGLDVPWWTAIVIGTVCLRLAVFPLVVLAQRNAAHMHNHMPTMQRLQQKMTAARIAGDTQQVVETSQHLMEYMSRNKVNPLKNMLVPFAQLPIFLSVFTGVRQMTSLPVESLKTGGMFWFTDLTIPDPYFALPILTVATLYATIEIGVDGIQANQMGSTGIKYVLRAMPILIFPFMVKFPAAMLCYWFTSNTFSLIQVLFLKIPQVKAFFQIPQMINHESAARIKEIKVPKQSFMDGFRQTMRNIELAKEMQERQRLNAPLRLKESTRSLTTQQSTVTKQQATTGDKTSAVKKSQS